MMDSFRPQRRCSTTYPTTKMRIFKTTTDNAKLGLKSAVVFCLLVLAPTLVHGQIPELVKGATNDVEYYICPSYISRVMGMGIEDAERDYVVRLRFRSGAVVGTELGALTKELLEGAIDGNTQGSNGDFRYSIKFHRNGDSAVLTLHIDGFRPVGVLEGRQIEFKPQAYQKLRICLDGYSRR
jgi:hypothetical protein